jgi:hypothetical protein
MDRRTNEDIIRGWLRRAERKGKQGDATTDAVYTGRLWAKASILHIKAHLLDSKIYAMLKDELCG